MSRMKTYQDKAKIRSVILNMDSTNPVGNFTIKTERFQVTRVIDSIITELISHTGNGSKIQLTLDPSSNQYLEIQFDIQSLKSHLDAILIKHEDMDLQYSLMKKRSIKLSFAKQLVEFLGGELELISRNSVKIESLRSEEHTSELQSH